MDITEVRIKLAPRDDSGRTERLAAFATVTFDGVFVVHDVKVIDGSRGFAVDMPSRKLTDRCDRCGGKNHLRARFCNQCGGALGAKPAPTDDRGRVKYHDNVAHPIDPACRGAIDAAVLAAYADELERSGLPGYACRYKEFGPDAPAPGPLAARRRAHA